MNTDQQDYGEALSILERCGRSSMDYFKVYPIHSRCLLFLSIREFTFQKIRNQKSEYEVGFSKNCVFLETVF